MPRLWLSAAVVLFAVLLMRPVRFLDSFAVAEQARVRAHFDSAEREVRGNSVAGLSVAQRAARARALDRLHGYAARGVFPRNRHFPGALVPSFVDDLTGTRCGMGYLIEEAGSAALVARIAATNNNATITDLKNDPELLTWLDRNGITLDEAARIQPSYGCEGFAFPPCPEPPPASTSYKVATGTLVVADMAAVAINALGPHGSRTMSGALALTSGALGMVIGIPKLDEAGETQTLGWVNTTVGVASAALGSYWLLHPRTSAAPVSFAPWVASNGAPGLSGRVTF